MTPLAVDLGPFVTIVRGQGTLGTNASRYMDSPLRVPTMLVDRTPITIDTTIRECQPIIIATIKIRSAKRKEIAANVYGDTGVTDEPPSPTTPGAN